MAALSNKAIEAREKCLAALYKAERDTDQERAHVDADDALCELLIALGHKDVVYAYSAIGKWYA
jgi:hypothetical protein